MVCEEGAPLIALPVPVRRKLTRQQFHIGMRSQTSNTLHRIRCDLAHTLLGNEAQYMLTADGRRTRFRHRIGWKAPAPGVLGYYSGLDCPIIHVDPNDDDTYNPADAFNTLAAKTVRQSNMSSHDVTHSSAE